MNDLLDSRTKDIEKRVRAEDPMAVERAAQLADQHPDEPKAWSLLAALGRKAEARADLEHVEDGYVGRTNRIRSKAEILEDCEE